MLKGVIWHCLKGSYDIAKNNIIWCNAMFMWFKVKKHIIFHILYIIVHPLCPAFLKRVDIYKLHHFKKRGVHWLASYPVHCDKLNTTNKYKLSSGELYLSHTPLYRVNLFVTYTIIHEEWNVFSAFNPSKCTHLEQWAADIAAPGEQSWTSCRSWDSNPQPWVTSGFKSNALSIRPRLKRVTEILRPLPTMMWCRVTSDDTKTIKPITNEAFVSSSGDTITDYNDSLSFYTLPCISSRINITLCSHLWLEKRQTASTTLHCSKLAFE